MPLEVLELLYRYHLKSQVECWLMDYALKMNWTGKIGHELKNTMSMGWHADREIDASWSLIASLLISSKSLVECSVILFLI
ncbi:unnamed protein product [Blepharisma stoltei]|uniref:Uncharacterized protein n=1 Tax=Blepharisma stoltei TaxID=1481888 RepID=A0AAU9JAH8_9CILI|nr:unnamed protein product [Blepharisma stoltei]